VYALEKLHNKLIKEFNGEGRWISDIPINVKRRGIEEEQSSVKGFFGTSFGGPENHYVRRLYIEIKIDSAQPYEDK